MVTARRGETVKIHCVKCKLHSVRLRESCTSVQRKPRGGILFLAVFSDAATMQNNFVNISPTHRKFSSIDTFLFPCNLRFSWYNYFPSSSPSSSFVSPKFRAFRLPFSRRHNRTDIVRVLTGNKTESAPCLNRENK